MSYFSEPGSFMILIDQDLPFFKMALSFLTKTKNKNSNQNTSFEITYTAADQSKEPNAAKFVILKMRYTESHSAISETCLKLPLADATIDFSKDYNLYGWINVSQLHKHLQHAHKNDKIVYIAFSSDMSDALILRVEPHKNKIGSTSVIVKDTAIKFVPDTNNPTEWFYDDKMAEYQKTIQYRFKISSIDFNECINIMEPDKREKDQAPADKKVDSDGQSVQISIYYSCSSFVWLTVVCGDNICSSTSQIKCQHIDKPANPKPSVDVDVAFQQPILYKATFLHKRFSQLLSNFKDATQIECNIQSNSAPIYFVYYSDWTTEPQHNYLRFIVSPKG